MKQTKLRFSPLIIALTVLTTMLTTILTVGSLRYGGPQGLWMRVQRVAISVPAHAATLPTPVLESNVQPALVALTRASDQTIELAAAAPTATIASLLPTPTPKPPKQTIQTNTTKAATATPSPLPPTPTAQTGYLPAQSKVALQGLRHEWQTWNNCGPATLSFYLSYYGFTLSQAQTGAALRHHADDKNVNPAELAVYARNQGMNAAVRVNGNRDLMRTLLSNGLPVLLETWLEEEPNDGMGHYRLLVGYDDAAQSWIAYDSYVHTRLVAASGSYQGIWLPYAETETLWQVFNHTYLLVYSPAQEATVRAILGPHFDETTMWQSAYADAWQKTQQQPRDAFAWFNAGSDLVALGDYTQAATAYDWARNIGLPWRMLWYQFGPFKAYYQTGRYQDIITLADATLANTKTIEEVYYWKGMALAQLGDNNGAQRLWQRVKELNQTFDFENQ